MTAIEFIRIALAVYYVAKMFTQSPGPFASFEWFRHWAGVKLDEHSNEIKPPGGTLAYWSQCVWCFSFSVSLLATASLLSPGMAADILLPFSLAGAVVLMQELGER